MPTNSVLINPSSILDAKTRIDINISSAATFFMNNFVYVQNNSLRSYIHNKNYERELTFSTSSDVSKDKSTAVLKPDLNNNKYHLYNRVNIQGPSFVFSQGDHAFGLGLSVKSYSDIRNFPKEVVNTLLGSQITVYQEIKAKNMSATNITYGDIKLSYAHTFKRQKRNMFMGGISFSKFIPIVSLASKIDRLNFEIFADNNDIGHIFEMNSNTSILQANKLKFLSGFGIDLGFTYQRMLYEVYTYQPNSDKEKCRRVYYLYKIGVSLMDIGKIKFQEDELDFQSVQATNFDWNRETISQNNFNVLNQFNKYATSDQSKAFIKNLTKMRLPSYCSFQADYNVWNNKLYANLTLVQRLPLAQKSYGVLRANSICFSARYETKFFEVAMPLSLYEYRYGQIGLSCRFWFLTLGTDKLLNMFIDSDIYGADVYFAFKIPIVYHPKCRDGVMDRFNFYPKKFRRKDQGCGLKL